MRHPFDGVMNPRRDPEPARTTRRSVLGTMLGAVAGLFGLAATAAAQTFRRRPTTLALGEEGGQGGPVTTFALGEEGGRVTTFALGEEGGRATTYALGEEGGYYPPPPRRATTYAAGEEGGWHLPRPPAIPAVPAVPSLPGRYTTQALGEEGGSYPWGYGGGPNSPY